MSNVPGVSGSEVLDSRPDPGAAAAFLAAVAKGGGPPNTVAAYAADLDGLRRFLDGRCPAWGRVRAEDLAAWLADLRARGYAEATVARRFAGACSFFGWLRAAGRVDRDPTEGVEPPWAGQTVPRVLAPDELAALLAAPLRGDPTDPGNLRDAAALHLLAGAGLGATELVSLDLGDLDPVGRTVWVGWPPRDVPVDPAAARAVAGYLDHGRPRLARGRPPTTALFLNHRGDRLTRQGLWLRLKRHARVTEVKASPRVLRASFAAGLLGTRADERDVQRLLGHRSVHATRRYAGRVNRI